MRLKSWRFVVFATLAVSLAVALLPFACRYLRERRVVAQMRTVGGRAFWDWGTVTHVQISEHAKVSAELVQLIQRLPNVRELVVYSYSITDKELAHIVVLQDLEMLCVYSHTLCDGALVQHCEAAKTQGSPLQIARYHR